MRRLLLAFALTAAACSDGGLTGPQRDELRADLAEARDKWEASRAESYEMVLKVVCGICDDFEADGYRIAVTGQEITAVTGLGSGMAVPPDQFIGFDSVDSLFEVIERLLDGEIRAMYAEYDRALGFPSRVTILWHDDAPQRYTDFHVSDVVPVP